MSLACRPLDPKGHHNLGTCLKALGRNEDALKSYGRAFALGSSSMADAAANAAGLLIKAGDSAGAVGLSYRVSAVLGFFRLEVAGKARSRGLPIHEPLAG